MYWAGRRARTLTGIHCGNRKRWERLGEAVIRSATSLPVAHPRDLRMVDYGSGNANEHSASTKADPQSLRDYFSRLPATETFPRPSVSTLSRRRGHGRRRAMPAESSAGKRAGASDFYRIAGRILDIDGASRPPRG